nr:glycoside hydrolase family 9 protein [Candidatus Sigynarchaeota archaeon]
ACGASDCAGGYCLNGTTSLCYYGVACGGTSGWTNTASCSMTDACTGTCPSCSWRDYTSCDNSPTYCHYTDYNPDDVQSYIGKFFYLEEKGVTEGNNWTAIDALVPLIIPLIGNEESWSLWFGWAGYYMLGNILMHYITFNRTVPLDVASKMKAIEQDHFQTLFDEPFRVKHGHLPGETRFDDVLALNDSAINARVVALQTGDENILFYGAERQTDMLTSAWLQLLMVIANATDNRPELVQSYLDWLFGVNPAGLCIMEGVGSINMPQYHHRYSYARNPRGAVPGCIPNGLAQVTASKEYAVARGFDANETNFLAVLGDRCSYGDWAGNPLMRDTPPSNPNEVWIPHDAMFLRIFTAMEISGLFK